MRPLMLGVTLRWVAFVRYGAVSNLVAYLAVVILSAVRRGQDLAPRDLPSVEFARLGGVPVAKLTDGGSTIVGGTVIRAAAPVPIYLKEYMTLLAAELAVYPEGALEKFGVREVVVCGLLSCRGRERGAIPDFDSGRLYLVAYGDPACRDYARRALHHELFHLADFRDDGLVGPDPWWERLNAPGFRYGGGGESMLGDPTAGFPDDTVAGFLNAYSRSGVEEDKAEVFSHMMVEPEAFEAQGSRDAILSSKHREMKVILERICPRMGEEFWKKIRSRK